MVVKVTLIYDFMNAEYFYNVDQKKPQGIKHDAQIVTFITFYSLMLLPYGLQTNITGRCFPNEKKHDELLF